MDFQRFLRSDLPLGSRYYSRCYYPHSYGVWRQTCDFPEARRDKHAGTSDNTTELTNGDTSHVSGPLQVLREGVWGSLRSTISFSCERAVEYQKVENSICFSAGGDGEEVQEALEYREVLDSEIWFSCGDGEKVEYREQLLRDL